MQVLKWLTSYLKHQVTIPIFSFVLSSYPCFYLHFLSCKLQWVSWMFRKTKPQNKVWSVPKRSHEYSLCRLFTGSFLWWSGHVEGKSSVFFHCTFKYKIFNPAYQQASLLSWREIPFLRRNVFSLLLAEGSGLLMVSLEQPAPAMPSFWWLPFTTFLLHWGNAVCHRLQYLTTGQGVCLFSSLDCSAELQGGQMWNQ